MSPESSRNNALLGAALIGVGAAAGMAFESEARADGHVAVERAGRPEDDCRWLEARGPSASSPVDAIIDSTGTRIEVEAETGVPVNLDMSEPLHRGWDAEGLSQREAQRREATGGEVADMDDLSVHNQPSGRKVITLRTPDIEGQAVRGSVACVKREGAEEIDRRVLRYTLKARVHRGENGTQTRYDVPAEDQGSYDEAEYGRERRRYKVGDLELGLGVAYPYIGGIGRGSISVVRSGNFSVRVGANVTGNQVPQLIDLPDGKQVEVDGRLFGGHASVEGRYQFVPGVVAVGAEFAPGICRSSAESVPVPGGRVESPAQVNACATGALRLIFGDKIMGTLGVDCSTGLDTGSNVCTVTGGAAVRTGTR